MGSRSVNFPPFDFEAADRRFDALYKQLNTLSDEERQQRVDSLRSLYKIDQWPRTPGSPNLEESLLDAPDRLTFDKFYKQTIQTGEQVRKAEDERRRFQDEQSLWERLGLPDVTLSTPTPSPSPFAIPVPTEVAPAQPKKAPAQPEGLPRPAPPPSVDPLLDMLPPLGKVRGKAKPLKPVDDPDTLAILPGSKKYEPLVIPDHLKHVLEPETYPTPLSRTERLIKTVVPSIVRGAGQMVGAMAKDIGILAKRIDAFGEYKDKKAQEVESYRIGQSIQSFVEKYFPPDPKLRESFFQDIAEGLGSLVGFGAPALLVRQLMKGGLKRAAQEGTEQAVKRASRSATSAALGTAATLGSLATAAEGFDRAITEGATEKQALEAATWGNIIGLSEAAPLVGIFRKMDKATNGKLKSAILQGALTGVEEAGQETFQSFTQNLAVQKIYNENQDLLAGIVRSGEVGGAVGLIAGFLTALARPRRAITVPPSAEQAVLLGPPGPIVPSEVVPPPGFPVKIAPPGIPGEIVPTQPKTDLSRIEQEVQRLTQGLPEELAFAAPPRRLIPRPERRGGLPETLAVPTLEEIMPQARIAPPELDVTRLQAKQITKPITPPATSEETAKKYAAFLDKALKHAAQDEAGQGILDDMVNSDISPAQVVNQFFELTFVRLPEPVQKRFRKMMDRLGYEMTPEQIMASGNKANQELDLPDGPESAEMLEGTERGFVVLMYEANRRVNDLEEGAKTEISQPTLAVPEAKAKVPGIAPKPVTTEEFTKAMASMKATEHAEALTYYSKEEYQEKGTTLYLSPDKQSGYGLMPDGELVSVFSHPSVKKEGRGDVLVDEAVQQGANRLDATGEHLRRFYERHGFVEVRREPNWTEGGPDVIFMERTVPHAQTVYNRGKVRSFPPGDAERARGPARQGVGRGQQGEIGEGLRSVQGPKSAVIPTVKPEEAPLTLPEGLPTKTSAAIQALDTIAEAASARMKARRGRLLSGLPIDDLVDATIYGTAKLAKGGIQFAQWSKQMIAELGEWIKPHLQLVFSHSKALASKAMQGEGVNETAIRGLYEQESEGMISHETGIVPRRPLGALVDLEKQDRLPPPNQPPPSGIPPTGAFAQLPAYRDFDIPEETTIQWVRRYVQDRMIRLEVVQRAIEESGRSVPEEADPRLIEELMPGVVDVKIKGLEKKFVRPLADEIAKSKTVDLDSFQEYLYAKNAHDVNEYVRTINDEFVFTIEERPGERITVPPDIGTEEPGLKIITASKYGGSGMTDEEAFDILAKFDQAGLTPEMERLAKYVYDLNTARLDTLEEGGLLSRTMRQAWEGWFPYYVPYRGVDGQPLRPRPGIGKGRDIRGKESPRRLGRKTRATAGVLEQGLVQTDIAVIRAEKNQVGQALWELASRYPKDTLWARDPVRWESYFDEQEKQVKQRLVKVTQGDNVLGVKIKGVQHYLEIKDPLLARAMKNLDAESSGRVVQTLQGVMRYFSLINTGLSGEFPITNFMRDVQMAGIHMTAQQGQKFARSVVKDAFPAMLGAWQAIRDTRGKSEWKPWFERYERGGGRIGFFSLETLEQKQKRFRNTIKIAEGDAMATARKGFRYGLDLVMDGNAVIENAVRVSLFRHAIEDLGFSDKKAGSLARNVTVDFNKKGEFGPMMNMGYLFANASAQGVAVVAKVLKGKSARRMAMGSMIGGFLWAEMVRMLAGTDPEDGENWFDKQPDYLLERQLLFPILGRPGEFTKWMMPYVWNVFPFTGIMMSRVLHGVQDPMEGAVSVVRSLLEAVNPLGTSHSLARTIVPTLMEPIIDLATNTNWYGGPIRPEQPAFGPSKPESQRYWKSVNGLTKSMTQKLNELGGGDEWHGSWLDVSPEIIDYLVGFGFGSMGNLIERSTHAITKTLGGDTLDYYEIPFVRKFLHETSPWATGQRFREQVEEVEREVNMKKALLERGEHFPTYDTELNVRGLISLEQYTKVARAGLRELANQRDAAEASEDIQRVERLIELMSRVHKWFGWHYREATAGRIRPSIPHDQKGLTYKNHGARLLRDLARGAPGFGRVARLNLRALAFREPPGLGRAGHVRAQAHNIARYPREMRMVDSALELFGVT